MQVCPTALLKIVLLRSCLPENFAKSLRTTFLWNTSGRLFQSRMLLKKVLFLYSITCQNFSNFGVSNVKIVSYVRRVTRGGRSPLPFFKNWKKCPNFGKNAMIVVILGWISHFKCGFKSFREKKKILSTGPLFHVL